MHEGPTENRLGELGSLYKYYYYYRWRWLGVNEGDGRLLEVDEGEWKPTGVNEHL